MHRASSVHHLQPAGHTCDLYLSQQLKMAKLEIRDLQVEFEEERNDLLATIRKLEREAQLTKGLLERMAPLVRRDCNYSNLDRLKKEAIWDEESAAWRLPEVVVQKTELPSGGAVNRKHQGCLDVTLNRLVFCCSERVRPERLSC